MHTIDILTDISKEQYIEVLQKEMQMLLQNYYRPKNEGTGHFNTAAGFLKCRIEELRKQT